MLTFLHRALQQYKDMCSQGSLWLLGSWPCVAKEASEAWRGVDGLPGLPASLTPPDVCWRSGNICFPRPPSPGDVRTWPSLGWIEVAILEFSIWLWDMQAVYLYLQRHFHHIGALLPFVLSWWKHSAPKAKHFQRMSSPAAGWGGFAGPLASAPEELGQATALRKPVS